jgi:hypothetical protein
VREKTAGVAKEAGFQCVSDDDIVVLLESHSLPLTNDELVELDMEMCKGAQDDHDDESIRQRYLTVNLCKKLLS